MTILRAYSPGFVEHFLNSPSMKTVAVAPLSRHFAHGPNDSPLAPPDPLRENTDNPSLLTGNMRAIQENRALTVMVDRTYTYRIQTITVARAQAIVAYSTISLQ